jgi:hypothetical protein
MSVDEADWKTGLKSFGLGVLVDAAPLAHVSVIEHPQRVPPFTSSPWLACVLQGKARVKNDAGLAYRLEAGQLVGQLGPLQESLLPIQDPLPSWWTTELEEPGTKLLMYRHATGLRHIWRDPQCVQLLRNKLSELGPDPWVKFLEESDPELFGGLKWPSECGMDLVVSQPNEHIFRRGERPKGIYVVVRGFVRLVIEGRNSRPNRLFGVMNPGAVFGELERPVDDRYLPNLLSALAGRTDDDGRYFGEALPTWLFRIPYEEWDKLTANNREQIDLDAKLFDRFRVRFATWLPVLTHASRSGLHISFMAALLLRDVYATRFATASRSWRTPLDASNEAEEGAATLEGIDLRMLLLEFCGGRPSEEKRHRQGVKKLHELAVAQYIVFKNGEPDWPALESISSYKEESFIATIVVPDVARLKEVL